VSSLTLFSPTLSIPCFQGWPDLFSLECLIV
jgi:hypothetical protein